MSRGPIIIVVIVTILIATFAAMCYLMTTVNPTPIGESDARRYNFIDDIYENLIVPRGGPFQYGLEKVSTDYTTFASSTHKPMVLNYNYEVIYDRNSQDVVSPLWPNGYTTTLDYRSNNYKENLREVKFVKPIKGRRSIKDQTLRNMNPANSLILKIIDDHGDPKIEIKMGRNYFNKKKARIYRSSNNKYGLNNLLSNGVGNGFCKDKPFTIETNDSIILNVIGSSVDLYESNDGEELKLANEMEFDKVLKDQADFKMKFNESSDDSNSNQKKEYLDSNKNNIVDISVTKIKNSESKKNISSVATATYENIKITNTIINNTDNVLSNNNYTDNIVNLLLQEITEETLKNNNALLKNNYFNSTS